MKRYLNRKEAGKTLAQFLISYQDNKNTIVLALPRGGVPVAYELATLLHLPLDVFIVRKLGVPTHKELAMGAIAMGGVKVLNQSLIKNLDISPFDVQHVVDAESKELARREMAYRGHRAYPTLEHKNVILVDDGIATGASMRAAIKALRAFNPARIIVAVPAAPKSMADEMTDLTDEYVCPLQPEYFNAVGEWYIDFSQTEDEEVVDLLHTLK